MKDADRENLSRRAFLAGVATLAAGAAATLTLGIEVANAATETNDPNGPKEPARTPAENKVEVVQNVDPKDDPLQAFAQPYYRHRRRVARRVYRRERRVVRRTYRRIRRRVY